MLYRTASFMLAAAVVTGLGCSTTPKPLEPRYPELKTIAVAPFFNRSSMVSLDGRQISDAFYGELQQIEGITVLPVGVVETAMYESRIRLASAEEAVKLAQLLDADAIVIGAVTDYDPYNPPRVGLAIQVYRTKPVPVRGAMLPESLDRLATASAPVPTEAKETWPLAVARIFDGGRPAVAAGVRRYARRRCEDQRLAGWRSYLQRSDDFVRYCCFAMVRDVLAAPQSPSVMDRLAGLFQ